MPIPAYHYQGCGNLNFCCGILLYTRVQASGPERFIVTFSVYLFSYLLSDDLAFLLYSPLFIHVVVYFCWLCLCKCYRERA